MIVSDKFFCLSWNCLKIFAAVGTPCTTCLIASPFLVQMNLRLLDVSEVGGEKPKVPRPGIRVPSSTSSLYRVSRTRRVTCVACRACDVARATDQ